MPLNPSTPDPIAEGLRLAEKATPRPWEIRGDVVVHILDGAYMSADGPEPETGDPVAYQVGPEDSAYIVHAANHFPDLAREVVRLRGALREISSGGNDNILPGAVMQDIARAALAAAEGGSREP